MKESARNLLIVSLVGVALICSIVVIFSESKRVHSMSEEASPEDVPEMSDELSPLPSHEDAIYLTNEFLKERLGDEFFYNHLKVIEIDEFPHLRYTWIVVYQYTYNGYTVDVTVAINIDSISKDTSRIDVDFSNVILSPQKILISEKEAKRVAQENGLEPPYTVILSCEVGFYRICWRVVKTDLEDLGTNDLAGVLIDAENGTVLNTWVRGT
jgi:hypothetical protein